jgi:hypothetical protein
VRAANGSIERSFDVAVAGLTDLPAAQFDIPGDFGPDVTAAREAAPLARDPASSTAATAAPSPSGLPSYSSPAAAPTIGSPAGSPSGAAVPTEPASAAPTASPAIPAASTGEMSALPQRFADALCAFSPSPDDAVSDGTPDDEAPEDEAPEEPQDELADEESEGEEEGEIDCSATEHAEPSADAPKTGVDSAVPVEPPSEPSALPPEPPAPQPSEQDAPVVDDGATPCEIAADELPQAGQ